MRLETVEEQTTLEVAEELGRLAVRLRAVDKISEAMILEDLVQQMTSQLTWIRATREQEQKVEEQDATASREPTATTGEENLETLRVEPSVADQLRSLLSSAR